MKKIICLSRHIWSSELMIWITAAILRDWSPESRPTDQELSFRDWSPPGFVFHYSAVYILLQEREQHRLSIFGYPFICMTTSCFTSMASKDFNQDCYSQLPAICCQPYYTAAANLCSKTRFRQRPCAWIGILHDMGNRSYFFRFSSSFPQRTNAFPNVNHSYHTLSACLQTTTIHDCIDTHWCHW